MSVLVRNLLLAFGAILASLAVFEGGLAATGFTFSFAPERVEFGFPDPEKMDTRYERDPDLYWVTPDYHERLEEIAQDVPDILFLGDSTTEWGDYPEFFIQRANSIVPGAQISGTELGVAGWSSYQGLNQMKRDIARLSPRFVTLGFGWNDHWIGFALEDKEIHTITRSPIEALTGLRVGQLMMKAHYAWLTRGRTTVDHRVPPEDFESNLREIVRIAREHEIVPVLLTAPTSHERDREPEYLQERWLRDLSNLVPLHQKYVGIVRMIAFEQDVPMCDLASDFAALPADLVRTKYFRSDGIHLKRRGDVRFANSLIECFRVDARLRELWQTPDA